jgi:hypothetical protein
MMYVGTARIFYIFGISAFESSQVFFNPSLLNSRKTLGRALRATISPASSARIDPDDLFMALTFNATSARSYPLRITVDEPLALWMTTVAEIVNPRRALG